MCGEPMACPVPYQAMHAESMNGIQELAGRCEDMDAVIKRQHDELVRLKNPMAGPQGEFLEGLLAAMENFSGSGELPSEVALRLIDLIGITKELRARDKAAHERCEKLTEHGRLIREEFAKANGLPKVEFPKDETVKNLMVGAAIDTGKEKFVIGQMVMCMHTQSNLMCILLYDMQGKPKAAFWYAPIPNPMKPKGEPK